MLKKKHDTQLEIYKNITEHTECLLFLPCLRLCPSFYLSFCLFSLQVAWHWGSRKLPVFVYANYVCMYVCMYICMYVCMSSCVCMNVCVYVCMYVCVYVYMYVCMYVYVYVCIYVWMYVCIYVCMCSIICKSSCIWAKAHQNQWVTKRSSSTRGASHHVCVCVRVLLYCDSHNYWLSVTFLCNVPLPSSVTFRYLPL